MNPRHFSLPLAANGRDFAFAVPDDLTSEEADFLAQALPPILSRCSIPGPDAAPAMHADVNKLSDTTPQVSESAPKRSLAPPRGKQRNRKTKKTRPGPAKLNGRFSRDHEACVQCGKSDKKHMGKGLCSRCYFKGREPGKPIRHAERTAARASAVQEKTVETPMRLAPWPFRDMRPSEAFKLAGYLNIHLRTQKTLGEIAAEVHVDVDKLRRIKNTFEREINVAMQAVEFQASLYSQVSRRYDTT